MGKGRIKQKLSPEGLYRIIIEYDSDIDNRIINLENKIELCDKKISEGVENSNLYKLQKESYKKEIDHLENVKSNWNNEDEKLAWCIHYEPIQIGKKVGTIEIDRENTGDNLNIQSNYNNLAEYNAERDGIMKPIALMHPINQLYNLAVSPSLQKYHPIYRHAEIYNIDYENDTCSVKIEPLYAGKGRSEYPLWINLPDNLFGVPIYYPPCNSQPFVQNDHVVVMFEDSSDSKWSKPKVIGFKTDPKPCIDHELVFVYLGEVGFIWDLEIDSYWEELPGINDYAECVSALSGKIETTVDHDNDSIPIAERGFPYDPMLVRFYNTIDYSVFRSDYVSKPKPIFDETQSCGEILTAEELSRIVVENEGVRTTTTTWSPYNCIFGEIQPGYTQIDVAVFNGYYYQWQSSTGGKTSMIGIVQNNTLLYNMICPIDFREEYFSTCTLAEYGCDAIKMADNSMRYSEKTLVQAFINSWCDFSSEVIGGTTYGNRNVVCHGGVNYWPWEVDDEEEKNPFEQERNDNFSDALVDLVNAMYEIRGAGPTAAPIPEYTVTQGNSEGYCLDGYYSYPYWSYVSDPYFEIKIYRK